MLGATALGYQLGLSRRRPLVLFPFLVVMVTGSMVAIIDFNRPRVGYTDRSRAADMDDSRVWARPSVMGFGNLSLWLIADPPCLYRLIGITAIHPAESSG